MIREYLANSYSIAQVAVDCLVRLFIKGTYPVLWFFPALIESLVLLHLMLKMIRIREIIVLGGMLYTIGTLMNYFRGSIQEYPLFRWYYSVLPGTQNGLFFGLFLVAVGYFFKTQGIRYAKRKLLFAVPLLFAMLCIEVIVVYGLCRPYSGFGMSFFVVPLTSAIFLLLKEVNISEKYEGWSIYCRNLSTCVYGLHMLFVTLVSIFENVCNIHLYSVFRYFVVLGITVVISTVIIQLSRACTAFKGLRILY